MLESKEKLSHVVIEPVGQCATLRPEGSSEKWSCTVMRFHVLSLIKKEHTV